MFLFGYRVCVCSKFFAVNVCRRRSQFDILKLYGQVETLKIMRYSDKTKLGFRIS